MVARRAGALLTVIVLVLGLGGAAASAKKKHRKNGRAWASQVTLTHPSSTRFAGVVSSKLGACAGSRVVTLSYTDSNTGQTLPLSVQRTDGSGSYEMSLTKDAFAGTYQVRVDERKIRARKAKQTCGKAQSSTIEVAAAS